MKYFKFTKVDSRTGISINVRTPIGEPVFPNIKGLQVLTQDPMITEFWYGTGDSTKIVKETTRNPAFDADPTQPEYIETEKEVEVSYDVENQVWELTKEQYATAIQVNINHVLARMKENLYEEEKIFRDQVLGKYHSTATVAGIYKYEQAKRVLIDSNDSAPDVRVEASARGVTVEQMAQRIVDNHEAFRTLEAKIAGVRGKILDRLNSFTFDAEDPEGSWNSLRQVETLGEGDHVDVYVQFYNPSFNERINSLG
jgi:hypothetical protein